MGRRAGRRMALTAMGCLVALLLTAMGATNAGAANLQEPAATCAKAAPTQTQGGTAGANGGGESGMVNGGDEACAVGGGVTATYIGDACSIVLPEGAVPGATIVVTEPPVQTGEGSGAQCRFEIINPDGSSTGGATGHEIALSPSACVFSVPNLSITADGAPGAVTAPGSKPVEPEMSGSGSGGAHVIEIKPGDLSGTFQTCGVVTVEPANVVGSATVNGAAAPAATVDACASFSGVNDPATPGQTGAVAVEQGVVVTCAGEIPAEQPVDGKSIVCTVTESAIVCPLQ